MTFHKKWEQEKLKIALQPSYFKDNFYINECNAEAFHFVSRVPPAKLHNKRLLLIGETYTGKTHLAHVWQEFNSASFINCGLVSKDITILPELNSTKIKALSQLAPNIENSAAVICDDIEKWDQEMLFHCINIANENDKPLLMTAKKLPDSVLPDLESRLRSSHIIAIYQPNDELLRVIVNKLLSDLQLRVEPSVIAKILNQVKKYGWANIHQFIAVAAKIA